MDINVVSTVPFPIDMVFPAMRDQLQGLAEFMPNIDRIVEHSREEPEPGVMKLLNQWYAARTEIPAMARPFVDPSKIHWHDRATWRDAEKLCEWSLEIGFMPDRIKCGGTTSYHAVGETTELHIKGRLDLDLKGLVPRLMLKKATSGVESFVGRLIEPNFQKTADALARYLDSRKDA